MAKKHSKTELLQNGIKVNEQGQWLFHSFAAEKNENVVNTVVQLIKAEKSNSIAINLVDNNGKTALHLAAEHGNYLMVESLLKLMTPKVIGLKDKFGKTALDYAKATEDEITINQLTIHTQSCCILLQHKESTVESVDKNLSGSRISIIPINNDLDEGTELTGLESALLDY
jgi:ankyrin repeat protein